MLESQYVSPSILLAHPHLLVRATNERLLSTRATFMSVLASESHWLQLVLILTVRWWPDTSKCGWAIHRRSYEELDKEALLYLNMIL